MYMGSVVHADYKTYWNKCFRGPVKSWSFSKQGSGNCVFRDGSVSHFHCRYLCCSGLAHQEIIGHFWFGFHKTNHRLLVGWIFVVGQSNVLGTLTPRQLLSTVSFQFHVEERLLWMYKLVVISQERLKIEVKLLLSANRTLNGRYTRFTCHLLCCSYSSNQYTIIRMSLWYRYNISLV